MLFRLLHRLPYLHPSLKVGLVQTVQTASLHVDGEGLEVEVARPLNLKVAAEVHTVCQYQAMLLNNSSIQRQHAERVRQERHCQSIDFDDTSTNGGLRKATASAFVRSSEPSGGCR